MDFTAKSSKLLAFLGKDTALQQQANAEYRSLGLGDDICEILDRQKKRKADALAKSEARAKARADAERAYREPLGQPVQNNGPEVVPIQTKKRKRELSGKEKLKSPDVYKTCVYYRYTLHISQYPKKLPSDQCDHGRDFCRMCIIAWIRSQFQDGNLPRCAICAGVTSHAYVEDITKQSWDRDILTRFETLLTRRTLEKVKDFVWCSAPGCEQGQIHKPTAGITDPLFKCNDCSHLSCALCRTLWHKGQSCAEYKAQGRLQHAMNEEERRHAHCERLSESMVKQLTRKCPGIGCGAPISWDDSYKDEWSSCEKMKCTQCGQEFCWRCGATYSEMKRNFREAHRQDCPWHHEVFHLWKRSHIPASQKPPSWEGTPQLGYQAPEFEDFGGKLLENHGWLKREEVQAEIGEVRRERAKRAKKAKEDTEVKNALEIQSGEGPNIETPQQPLVDSASTKDLGDALAKIDSPQPDDHA